MRALLMVVVVFLPACLPSEGPSPLDCGHLPVHINDPLGGETFQLAGPDACVRLVRRDLAEPDVIYKARPWALEQMIVSHTGGHEEVTEGLEWVSSHHNWFDQALGQGALYRYRVDVTYGPNEETRDYGWSYSLSGLDEDGEVAVGPFPLEG